MIELTTEIALQTSIKAAIACYDLIGKDDAKKADHVAVEAMRNYLNNQKAIKGIIRIGEGERDEAPMLYIGEELGSGNIIMDIAVDPLEGTNLCAKSLPNSITAIAIAEEHTILHAPDLYMQKIATKKIGKNVVDLDKSIEENIANLSKKINKKISDMNVIILNRKRHEKLINDVKNTGAKLVLIEDGDLSAIMSVAINEKYDLYIGSGGAPEGVLAACALKTLDGYMQSRLIFATKEDIERNKKMNDAIDQKLEIHDMIKGNVIFAITGVTNGDFLNGVMMKNEKYITESLILNSFDKSIRKIVNEL